MLTTVLLGLGLTILLSGPPGVGKTLIAETIAKEVARPLINMNLGFLVANAKRTDEELRKAFENASKLKAILVLDEADVVLEKRSYEDLQRNAIVSGESIPQMILCWILSAIDSFPTAPGDVSRDSIFDNKPSVLDRSGVRVTDQIGYLNQQTRQVCKEEGLDAAIPQ